MEDVNMKKKIQDIYNARPTSDGAGVKLDRVFGGFKAEQFDPFLLLDAFGTDKATDYIAGFPSHPHRGFETVTYMLEGKMLHEDHMGNRGLLNDGDVQWMTAAKGIIHSEMPQQTEGRMSGFQLWINLPANEKMKPASYRDISADKIPQIHGNDYSLKLIAGNFEWNGEAHLGAVNGISTNPLYLDAILSENANVVIPTIDGYTTLVYVYQGNITIAGKTVSEKQLATLERDGELSIDSLDKSRFLILSGKPINEPIVQHGPFVMNTFQEIEQAIQDYRDGILTS